MNRIYPTFTIHRRGREESRHGVNPRGFSVEGPTTTVVSGYKRWETNFDFLFRTQIFYRLCVHTDETGVSLISSFFMDHVPVFYLLSLKGVYDLIGTE